MQLPNAVFFVFLCARSISAIPAWASPTGYGPDPTGYLPSPSGYPSKRCLTDADAKQISDAFFTVTGGKGIFNLTIAKAILASDYSDSSESVASIVDEGGDEPLPLLRPTFSSKKAFDKANALQPRTEFEALNLYHNCDTVFQRFQVTNLHPYPPRGISIFETQPAPAGNLYPYQIKQVYGEIDSIAWLVDAGVYKPKNATLTRR